ncbi:hypothetical protein K491DRAFT_721821 [Lophiostoma macrostomum CBS 122681]|uniref:Uncharacterized protein n=1 Tax=Lophiostoma macrostomum CBS 122681 TaxID=1314788 RepID=A0A6A6SRR1_9PLEO|nr:hypothetical protein K491DRAFT_721821 [Lophiostoma macrostomum CBS 122681]
MGCRQHYCYVSAQDVDAKADGSGYLDGFGNDKTAADLNATTAPQFRGKRALTMLTRALGQGSDEDSGNNSTALISAVNAGLLLLILATVVGATVYIVRKYQREQRAREVHHHHHYESPGNGIGNGFRKALYSDKEAALDAV